ncbi:lipoprotein [Cytobacillus oceanisediminis]|uniref:Uncharacterized protein n=1 Tax=Cytobacillus oceanisediminis 2691 TaxID=1196031 RepID=A0A161J5A7_9BACI|nr:lipoprotein [Cytobacillus oceanisediminis]AND39561.1 hypothetical protein A361_10590 [Cytobacillus oceanisediminis 2691]
MKRSLVFIIGLLILSGCSNEVSNDTVKAEDFVENLEIMQEMETRISDLEAENEELIWENEDLKSELEELDSRLYDIESYLELN